MAQQLKTKIINVVGQLFCRQSKAKFLLEIDQLYWWSRWISICRDIDSEFTQFQTPRKKIQLIVISSVTLHAFMKTLKSSISEAYEVQVGCLKDSESDSYDKNDMKEKVNDLVRLHEAMQEKLITASYSEQI